MLQLSQQRPLGPAPVEFLIEFTKGLIQLHPSEDVIQLATAAAMKKVPITEEQLKVFQVAVGLELKRASWPDGFF